MPIKPDIILNVTGLQCPVPVIRLKKSLDIMRSGQIIEVISNDKRLKSEILALCKRLGIELISSSTSNNGITRFLIKK
jgi:tRNA 2-thiouridine synthesizing protein A